jgi:hypothetical protein
MIEHISKSDGLRLLQECWRILKPGGVIRLTIPDLDWFCSSLLKGTIDCDLINGIFFNHQHVYLYSRLRISAFIDIRQSSFRDPAAALGYLDSHAVRFAHAPELSHYVEAQRPIEISVNEECSQEQPKRRATPNLLLGRIVTLGSAVARPLLPVLDSATRSPGSARGQI